MKMVLINTETMIRICIVLIVSLSFSLPIVYALMINNWDINSLITPIYERPKFWIEFEFIGPRIMNEVIILLIAQRNYGDLGITIRDLSGSISSRGSEVRFPIEYHGELYIAPNSSAVLRLNISETMAIKLLDYLWRKEADIFRIDADLKAEILGTEIEVSFVKEIHISLSDLGIKKELAGIEIISAEYVDGEILLNVNVMNPFECSIKVNRMNATVYMKAGQELGYLSLVNPEEIEAGRMKVVKLRLLLKEGVSQLIAKELVLSNKLDIVISGTIVIEVLENELEIPIEEHYMLTSDLFEF